jgi:hypothetical protein
VREHQHAKPTAHGRRPLIGRWTPGLILVTAGWTILASIGVCVGAVLAPAPPAVLPLVVVISVGCPMFVCGDASAAIAALRADRAQRIGGRALARFRARLDELPETEHPLGYE